MKTNQEMMLKGLNKLKEQFISIMKWSPYATDMEKTLVFGNLEGFCCFLSKEMPAQESQYKYVIWSNEHKAWWGHNHRGYYENIKQAGLYKREEALKICNGANYGWDENKNPHELPILLEDALLLNKITYVELECPSNPPFLSEGDYCPTRKCHGRLVHNRIDSCSCHINPPCSACTDAPLICLICDHIVEV